MDIDNWFVNLFELDSRLRLDEESFAYLDINHDGVITPDEIARRIEACPAPRRPPRTRRRRRWRGLAATISDGRRPFKRLTGYFSKAPEPATPETKPMPEQLPNLVALPLGIFFVVYPAVISYLWFYYIPTRVPSRLANSVEIATREVRDPLPHSWPRPARRFGEHAIDARRDREPPARSRPSRGRRWSAAARRSRSAIAPSRNARGPSRRRICPMQSNAAGVGERLWRYAPPAAASSRDPWGS